MNKYKIEFSEELKKEYGLKDFIVTTEAVKQDYLEQLRCDIYEVYNLADTELLNDDNINIYEA